MARAQCSLLSWMSVLQCKSLASRLHYGDPGCLIRHKHHQHHTKTGSPKTRCPVHRLFPIRVWFYSRGLAGFMTAGAGATMSVVQVDGTRLFMDGIIGMSCNDNDLDDPEYEPIRTFESTHM
ncbi:uncharacterized protein FFB20_06550 [Fusarium fujikuroi]|uniref:Uncharacterized protein n=1 Tax=Fusarium fujikuroi TaxID=5127 RepID=A0A2H3RXT7_FUSFU|nr:uncharacterized protein FFE2_04100 [Fusarium fujikuroi]SCN81751.1 uncharacterized protein FFB20_06550 [Fusarium fujikuroi]SCN96838.1 uncharacterized protein FFC1_07683 [Fusarium fujikuroi]SCO39349.1 uncharacterized protein FFNC_06683 [Fusarium fujikuroi]SCV30150.1 uncharacterized protein FFFS_02141 [Fusarium fujikuroi]